MKEFLVGLVGLVFLALFILALLYLGEWIVIAIALFVLVLLIKSVGDFMGRVVTAIFEEVFNTPQPPSRRFKA